MNVIDVKNKKLMYHTGNVSLIFQRLQLVYRHSSWGSWPFDLGRR